MKAAIASALLILVAQYAHGALKFQKFARPIEGEPVEVFVVTDDGHEPSVDWMSLVPGPYPAAGHSIPELASSAASSVAVNANFYSEDVPGQQEPLGLVMHEGKLLASPSRQYPTVGLVEGRLQWDNVTLKSSSGRARACLHKTLAVGTCELVGERLGAKWMKVREAVSGSHLLTPEQTHPRNTRAWAQARQPRAFVGADQNGRGWVAVFDGRREKSKGVSVKGGWLFLRKIIGAAWALNLDGGGSATMLFEGRLVNRPSDGIPRAVAVGFGAKLQ